jgi:hypothetical protein
MVAWLQLLRVALVPTVLWDAAAGALLAGAAFDATLLAVVGSVLPVYLGGMALNDFADFGSDARDRPGRPIPSGRVSPAAALVGGLFLMAVGNLVAQAFLAPTAAQAVLLLSGVVLLYDLGGAALRRGLGPPLLALARGISLALPLLADGQGLFDQRETVQPYLAYVLYFLFLSRLASREEQGSPGMRALAFVLATALAPVLAFPAEGGLSYGAGWLLFAAWIAVPALRDRHRSWDPGRVQAAVRRGLAAAPAVPGLALIGAGNPWGLAAPLVAVLVGRLARLLPPE